MRRVCSICLPVLLMILPVSAELFHRNGGPFLERLGYTRAYRTPMQINGEAATVEVWNSADGFFKTLAELEDHCDKHKLPGSFTTGESIGFGMALDGSTLHRWLVTRVDDADRHTIIYQTTTALEAFTRGGGQADREHQLAAIPPFDQSEALGHYHDGNTDTEVEVSHSAQPAIFIQTWFDRTMQAAGWVRPLADAGPAGTRVFHRKNERAFVTLRDAKQGGSLITRIYKKTDKH